MRAEQQAGENPAMAIAEHVHDHRKRAPRVLERLAPCEKGTQHVDQHDLPRIVPEVIETKPLHRLALVDLEALRHESAERVRSQLQSTFLHVEWRKPEVWHVAERPAAQETARLQVAQAVLVARAHEERVVEVMRLSRELVACRLLGAMATDESKEVARDLRPAALAHRGERCARPFAKALLQKRQIEQPLTRIIDDLQGGPRRTAGNLAQELSDRICRHETQIKPDLAEIDRAIRPVRTAAGHLFDIAEIGKSRQPVRLCALEIGGEQAALPHDIEKRHPVWVVDGAQEIMNQARNEHGLAGAGKARNGKPDRPAARKLAEIADQTF